MGLSCTCDYWDGDGWCYMTPDDFSELNRKRAVRCRSCGILVKPGEECVEFERMRGPQDDIEERIYGEGEEIKIASWFQCAKCGEMYLNLKAYGYCVPPDENVFKLLKEHWEMTGFGRPE